MAPASRARAGTGDAVTPQQYEQVHLVVDGRVARVTLDNPPVNVLGFRLMTELRELLVDLAADDGIRVVVFDSADRDFFLAHVDMGLGEQQEAVEALTASAPPGLTPFQALDEQLRHLPQVTIVELAGKARGGGAEFVAAADMAFAARETAYLGQVEALMGIVPGGGGTQYLEERLGRARALEVVLGSELFDADTAERYGWVNRSLPADQLRGFVDQLARNVAALPDGVVQAAKAALPPRDLSEGLAREGLAWAGLVVTPAAGRLIADGLRAGAQTPAGEQDLEGLLRRLPAVPAPAA